MTPVTPASASRHRRGVRRVADAKAAPVRSTRAGVLGDVEPEHPSAIRCEALADGQSDEAARAGDGDAGASEVH